MSLFDYVSKNLVVEGRPLGSKNKPKNVPADPWQEISQDEVVVGGKVTDRIDPEKQVGKKAESNNSRGAYAIDEPTNDDLMATIDWDNSSSNVRILEDCFDAEMDFFIQGRAGWAKTSLIKKTAKRHGLSIVTVYLDKALATDLDGIPVALDDGEGGAKEARAMPGWAQYMYSHPEKNFLLFFDEMNQAAPDVQNALMPIILDHRICNKNFDNFFCGAAGNYGDENKALNELSGPLRDRFEYLEWESNTDETWKESMDFLRGKWEKVVGKPLMDAIDDAHAIFENPRDVERYVLTWFSNIYKKSQNEKAGQTPKNRTPEHILKHLKLKLRDQQESGLTRSEYDKALTMLAEAISTYLKFGPNGNKAGRGGSAPVVNIQKQTLELIKNSLNNGYVNCEGYNLGVSLENWADLLCDEDGNGNQRTFTAQEQEWVLKKLKALGCNPRYKKDSEFIADGFTDYKTVAAFN